MAGTWTSERLPQFEAVIRGLAEEHRKLEDEPPHLALVYLPRREGEDVRRGIFLLEVIGGAADSYGQDDLFETTFEVVPGLPNALEQLLHLILATPRELGSAVERGWPLAVEIADAMKRGDYKVLHADPLGKKLVRKLRTAGDLSRGPSRG